MNTVTVPKERLKKLIFEVYDRGNVSTKDASELLEMETADFVTEFEEWQNLN